MRVLIYGAASVATLAACAEIVQAARARPVWRNDRFFRPGETEPTAGVVCLEGAEQSPAIVEAYRAKQVPVFVVPPEDFEASDVAQAFSEFVTHGIPTRPTVTASGGDPSADRAERDAIIADLRGQIDRLASVIIAEVPGEPSQSEGACDTAIRVLRDQRQQLATKDTVIAEQAAAIAALQANLAAAPGESQTPASDDAGEKVPPDVEKPGDDAGSQAGDDAGSGTTQSPATGRQSGRRTRSS